MSQLFRITVNGRVTEVRCAPDAPLLYILRNDLALSAPKFGCGLGQCGACTVHVAGRPARSCVTPIDTVGESPVTTLEGLSHDARTVRLQKAFLHEQAAQCGYCTNGMIMTARALLDEERGLTDGEIRAALSANLCRCGVHNRIVRAVRSAALETAHD